jgi:diacylglycerol kinase family enzyme
VIAAHRDPARLKNVEAFSCSTLRAESAHPLPVQADGDIVGFLPASMTVGKTALSFC